MEHIRGFLFTSFVGFLGFLLFRRLKIPTPALLGSIIATGTLNALGYFPVFEIRVFAFLSQI